MLRERIEGVWERIQEAALRAGRRREEIALVAVTKTVPAAVIAEAYALGLRNFGENYVQEFEGKWGGDPFGAPGHLAGARFHLIGHLQSNKSNRAAELFDVIQTVDSARLGRRINDAPRRRSEPLEVMIEVKLTAEQAKSGAAPEELPALADALAALPNLRLTGLMTMPPWSDDPETSRPYFSRLRELAAGLGLPQLSMGMSHDLEVAIEEGATVVRVGTALFGRRDP
jgi:PLP dependent protein